MTVDVHTFFADGSPRRTERPRPSAFEPRSWTFSPDPLGGSLLVQWGPTTATTTTPPQPPCLGDARRFDATGAPAGEPGGVGCDVIGAGVSNAGEALVLEAVGADRTLLRWLRRDGTAARPPAEDSYQPFLNGAPLVALLDGSLVAREGVAFTRRYPRLATASEPAPAWLAARKEQSFRFTRGNKGYAFFLPSGQQPSDCAQVVELVAPNGRRCARLTFRQEAKTCFTGSIDQGWDGTVVQQLGSGACSWRAWPALLGE